MPLKIDYPQNKTISTNLNNNNVIFTEGGNLNTNNNNNSFCNNDKDCEKINCNFNDESSENEQFEISLKQFEKTQNKNLSNLIINSGELNNKNSNKMHTENVTTRQNQNKKISIFTEKRKNTVTNHSYTKDMINDNKKKDFKIYFNEGKNSRENNTNYNYNFFHFRNIYLDKKILFDNKIENNNTIKNNRTSSNFKNNKINKKSNKGISDNFRSGNINKKNYKNNNIYSNGFRRMILPSKKYINK